MPLQKCPEDLSLLTGPLIQVAQAWLRDLEHRPCPSAATMRQWDALVDEWAQEPSIPLFVRKSKDNRGALLTHETGRGLIPSDNSPAHWAFTLACAGECPTLSELRNLIESRAIPVAMVTTAVERSNPYTSPLTGEHAVNAQGWKLAHVNPVGIKKRLALTHLPLDDLLRHFRNFIRPSNMFVVPLPLAGLAETTVVTKVFGAA